MKHVASKEMVENALGDQYDDMAEPPYTEIDKEHPLAAAIIAGVRDVFDPEIPVNIYELGLIYKINIDENNYVKIDMTLTTPNCPVAESLPNEVKNSVKEIKEVKDVDLKLVWEPPWDKSMMSEAAKLELNL